MPREHKNKTLNMYHATTRKNSLKMSFLKIDQSSNNVIKQTMKNVCNFLVKNQFLIKGNATIKFRLLFFF